MPQRGKLVVVLFFSVGLTLALGAIGYHYFKTRWAMNFWGQRAARVIVRAPQVELLRLESPAQTMLRQNAREMAAATPVTKPEGKSLLAAGLPEAVWTELLAIGGEEWGVTEVRDISQARGLIHMRMALVEDANFDIAGRPPGKPNWDYVFRFSGTGETVLVVVDSQQGLVGELDLAGKRPIQAASIAPIASGMRKFLRDQFPEDEEPKLERSLP